jgi:oligopeptide transport system ATP-binding protein
MASNIAAYTQTSWTLIALRPKVSEEQVFSPLLSVKDLSQHYVQHRGLFRREKSIVKAVDGVSFHIDEGETLGLVGESGCGKSTLGRSILRLLDNTSGQVLFKGKDVLLADSKELALLRQKMQIVFQDPFASLNPRMSVGNALEEPLLIHKHGRTKEERITRIKELLDLVGLKFDALKRYPHEFSGGQRQRIGIARALAVLPEFVVCDEPTSALDVSIQAQVINLLQDLQYRLSLTYLFIAHDLHVVRHIATRIAVMYLGNIVELADAKELCERPQHPYSEALISSVPIPDPRRLRKRILLSGEVPSPLNPPSGCKFHPRCPKVMPICKEQVPVLVNIGARHQVACHLF